MSKYLRLAGMSDGEKKRMRGERPADIRTVEPENYLSLLAINGPKSVSGLRILHRHNVIIEMFISVT